MAKVTTMAKQEYSAANEQYKIVRYPNGSVSVYLYNETEKKYEKVEAKTAIRVALNELDALKYAYTDTKRFNTRYLGRQLWKILNKA